ncbi:MAG: zinc ribbon domain-containing protein, partial [Chloroflexi bacterium]|nr:zinc ribbon domain-containing protein [Chloroflexota bacterium]
MDLLISWPGGDWQVTARLIAVLLTGYLLVLWVASVLWVYRDIRARTGDPVTQGIAVAIAVVFPVVGLPVYMVLRPGETVQQAYERQLEQEAILSELHSISACPSCRRPIEHDWVVCAHCSSQLRTPCTSCGRPLQFAWRHCPHCATARPRPP